MNRPQKLDKNKKGNLYKATKGNLGRFCYAALCLYSTGESPSSLSLITKGEHFIFSLLRIFYSNIFISKIKVGYKVGYLNTKKSRKQLAYVTFTGDPYGN